MDERKVGIEKLEDSKAYNDFIASLKTKSTKTLYSKGIRLFCSWYGKGIDEILEERKDDVIPRPSESMVESKQRSSRFERELEKFWNIKVNEGYLPSTATSFCKGLMQIFRYFNMPISLRSGSPISEGREYTEVKRFPLTPEVVRKFFWQEKQLKFKTIISMANDLGWRISDFIAIKIDELPNLEQQAPIEFQKITKKEHIFAKSCLSRDTVALLKEYLEVFKPKVWLWEHNGGHIDESTINRRLKELAYECSVNTKGYSLSFHCFRDYILSTAKNLDVDPDRARLLIGKKVKSDTMSYLSGVDVKEAFNRIHEITRINGDILKREQVDLLVQQGLLIQGLQTRIENLEKELTQKHGYTLQQLNEIRDVVALAEEKFYLALKEARETETESLKQKIETLENAIKSMKKEENEINPSRR